MKNVSMNQEEIQQMLDEQKTMFLSYEKLTEADIKINKEKFFEDAVKLGWDIEIDNYIERVEIEVSINDATIEELSKLYQEIIGEDTEALENFGYLKIMVNNAKEKQKLLGKVGEHFSLFFHEDELRKFVRENGHDTFKVTKSEYDGRFGK